MTEPTKEKVEKWKGEFEKSDYVRNYGYWRCLRKNFYGAYDDPDTERLWQGYLAAKNSDFEEIKTLKEQLQQKEEQLALAAVEFENLLNAQLANGEYEKCVALIRNALNSENQESPKTTKDKK